MKWAKNGAMAIIGTCNFNRAFPYSVIWKISYIPYANFNDSTVLLENISSAKLLTSFTC